MYSCMRRRTSTWWVYRRCYCWRAVGMRSLPSSEATTSVKPEYRRWTTLPLVLSSARSSPLTSSSSTSSCFTRLSFASNRSWIIGLTKMHGKGRRRRRGERRQKENRKREGKIKMIIHSGHLYSAHFGNNSGSIDDDDDIGVNPGDWGSRPPDFGQGVVGVADGS